MKEAQLVGKWHSRPKMINGIQVNVALSRKGTTYRFLTEQGTIETIDGKTGEVLKSEINKDICDPADLIS